MCGFNAFCKYSPFVGPGIGARTSGVDPCPPQPVAKRAKAKMKVFIPLMIANLRSIVKEAPKCSAGYSQVRP